MPIDVQAVKGYFNDPRTVLHYCRAVGNVGLWRSEASLFDKWFERGDRILDIGCGAGRIALGLWQAGYRNIEGIDLAERMVVEAEAFASAIGAAIRFRQGDATQLDYPDCHFDGAIFGFNGLMQIPGRERRRAALKEFRRALRPGGLLIFTTLDRDDSLYRRVFSVKDDPAHDPLRNIGVFEYGDRHFETEHGHTFMHVPDRASVEEDLRVSGLALVDSRMRSAIAEEEPSTLEFAEDCRFWIAQRPIGGADEQAGGLKG